MLLDSSSQSKIFQLMANTTFAENSKAILYNVSTVLLELTVALRLINMLML